MTDPSRFGLVISDVDGTLVNHDKQLTPAVADAVRRLEASGVAFTLVSARCPRGVQPLIETLGVKGPVAAYNGGTIFTGDGEVIEHHLIPADVTRGLLAMTKPELVSIWVFADGVWHADTTDNPHVARERLSANQEPVIVTDFDQFADRAEKLTVVSDDAPLLARLSAAAQAKYGGQATIAQSQTYFLDVTATVANKGDAVAALAKTHGVPLDKVAVFGDQFNDVPMFDRAGFSVAMGQAPDGVKAKADEISTSNEENGVAVAIDRYILPRVAA